MIFAPILLTLFLSVSEIIALFTHFLKIRHSHFTRTCCEPDFEYDLQRHWEKTEENSSVRRATGTSLVAQILIYERQKHITV